MHQPLPPPTQSMQSCCSRYAGHQRILQPGTLHICSAERSCCAGIINIEVLLCRHYQETAAEPFCCFHVYKGNRRVLVHSEEQCVVRSTYTSTPNCLVRLSVPKGDSSYMLVASLYEDTGILPFTLTSYAVEPHSLLVGMDCPYVEAQPGGLPGGGQKQTWMARCLVPPKTQRKPTTSEQCHHVRSLLRPGLKRPKFLLLFEPKRSKCGTSTQVGCRHSRRQHKHRQFRRQPSIQDPDHWRGPAGDRSLALKNRQTRLETFIDNWERLG